MPAEPASRPTTPLPAKATAKAPASAGPIPDATYPSTLKQISRMMSADGMTVGES